jgi:hypothetical protein
MKKHITDEKTGISYTLHGDYYLPDLELPAEKERSIGIWGQRHLRYIREHRKALYTGLFLDGKLNGYLADLNEQAEDMFLRLVNELAEKEGIKETLKAENQMLWVQRMNAIQETATEIVNNDLIYA